MADREQNWTALIKMLTLSKCRYSHSISFTAHNISDSKQSILQDWEDIHLASINLMLKINSQNHSELIVLYPLSVVCSEHQHTQVKMISALTH